VADPRAGATAYTGSRSAGLALKAAADRAGKPIYLELSSVNPVVILPGAIEERGDAIAQDFMSSCLMGTGQFCTNPGIIILMAGPSTERFLAQVSERFRSAPVGTLLSAGVLASLESNFKTLVSAGAKVLVGGTSGGGMGYTFANSLMSVSGAQFLSQPERFQTEVFGNASLCVVAENLAEMCRVVDALEGNLTGCVYSHTGSVDDLAYDELAPRLRRRVGRLLNDKMPTGVAVSPAMNHGGPYPATGHPGFTAVGIPAALRRFTALECFDNVRHQRLPAVLKNCNPTGSMWRLVDGAWAQADAAG
jgi:2,5-dioxopentanoate dehydrogenase